MVLGPIVWGDRILTYGLLMFLPSQAVSGRCLYPAAGVRAALLLHLARLHFLHAVQPQHQISATAGREVVAQTHRCLATRQAETRGTLPETQGRLCAGAAFRLVSDDRRRVLLHLRAD